ncbi:hypothetical protein FRC17_005021 [Serendipita sp. 399]|nr:hypothetical protein FRC17_005021 [Serendipita sp. 399]
MDRLETVHALTVAATLAIAGAVCVYLASKTPQAKARKVGARLPPGLKGSFLVGNLFNFPKNRWFETFTSWGRQYGDIVYINILGKSMVILNSIEAAEDLAGKRMSVYSGRPYSTMSNDLMGSGYSLILLPQGSEFNEQRKYFKMSLGAHVVESYDGLIQRNIRNLINEVNGYSGDPYFKLVKSIGEIVTIIAYGEHIYRRHGDELVQLNTERTDLIAWVFTKFWTVNVLPFLRYIPAWFPGAYFQRVAKRGSRVAYRVRFWPFEMVKDAMAKGIADESLVSKYMDGSTFTEMTNRDATSVMYAAGVDTTSTSLCNLFYALVLFPEWQTNLQKELDEVVGQGHFPAAEDIPKLRLFNALWKESLRWNPPVPLGIPHVNSEADVYRGYYIPKGSIIHCNIGAMLRDSRVWGEDSEQFNPNRFLPEFNLRAESLPDINNIPFGFGRRICPGRFLAERIGHQLVTAILSAYTLVPVEGEAMTFSMTFEDSTIRGFVSTTFDPSISIYLREAMDRLETGRALAATLAIAGVVYVYLASRSPQAKARKAGARLPPGPQGIVLVGNLFNFPKSRWFEAFISWGRQYGDIVYINILGKSMVILNTIEAAEDLAGKRMAVYSGRPYSTMSNDLMGSGYSLILLPQGSEFNEQRKFFKMSLGAHVVERYDGLIQRSIRDFINDVNGYSGDPFPQLMRQVKFGEWQTKLQKELDEVVGQGHFPAAEDISKLRLFNAVWKESLRWNPPAPLGLPHVNSQADVYKGYYIPKGSIIHCNIGAMLRDSRVWGEDSEQFSPNRFLPEFNPQAGSLPDMSNLPFGFGRRICPGRFLAERIGHQVIAAVLSKYTLVPVEGETVPFSMTFEDSIIRRPSDFRCHFQPRYDLE